MYRVAQGCLGFWDLGFRDSASRMENPVDKRMANFMETEFI